MTGLRADAARPRPRWRREPVKRGALVLLLGAVFVADTITALEIAIAVFHVIPILLSVTMLERRGVIAVIVAGMTLTLCSYLLSAAGAGDSGLVNLTISLSAIAASGWLAIRADTAQREMQAARAHAAHMARVTALGELSATIAHEVNQPLAAIMTSSHACQRWLAATPPNHARATQTLQRSIDDAERASEIVTRVRRLASPATPAAEVCDVGAHIREALALLATQLTAAQIEVDTDLAPVNLLVRADPVQLQQVLLNLCMNAIESLSAVHDRQRRLRLTAARHDASVAVTVEDNGVGLAAESHARLFDAFFTTKQGGMGMGLAITRSIVESLGGAISAQRNPSAGATVGFTLPAFTETPP